jgi:hypothetical protein
MILTTKTTRRDELRMRNDPSIKVMCLASELRDYGFGSGMTYWERPYQHDSTASRPLSEVKHVRAWLVLRWGTTLESQVLFSFWRLFAAYDPSITRPKVYLRLLPVWYCFNRILPTQATLASLVLLQTHFAYTSDTGKCKKCNFTGRFYVDFSHFIMGTFTKDRRTYLRYIHLARGLQDNYVPLAALTLTL